jgi:hypothetical protein
MHSGGIIANLPPPDPPPCPPRVSGAMRPLHITGRQITGTIVQCPWVPIPQALALGPKISGYSLLCPWVPIP